MSLEAIDAFDAYEEYLHTADDDSTQVYRKSEVDREIRKQKRKRCIAMAEMCNARYDEEDAKVNGSGMSWEYISKEMKYWERWRNKWIELADKFKE